MKKYARKRIKIKRKKSIFKKLFFWLIFLFLLLAISGIYFLVFFEKIQIKEINISGNEKIPARELQKYISEKIKQNFWFLNSQSIFLADLNGIKKSVLKQYPDVDSLEIKKALPSALAVEIKEREPLAIFCNGTECSFIDKKGVVFEKTAGAIGEFSIIRQFKEKEIILGEEAVPKENMDSISKILSNFQEKLKIGIKEFDISSSTRLNVKTDEGWQVYFDIASDIGLQITKLDLLLEKEISQANRGDLEYIDLRFKRVYYK
jgi:cell division septal protein FtsQ